jgi:hypothetical protein
MNRADTVVIHRTASWRVTQYGRGAVLVIERLEGGSVRQCGALTGFDAREFLGRWRSRLRENENRRPIPQPFSPDSLCAEYRRFLTEV